MSLTLLINGQNQTFDRLVSPANLAQVITELNLKDDRIAVEHNGQIATRGLWGETFILSGDRLEVVHFVGGGCFIARAFFVGGFTSRSDNQSFWTRTRTTSR